MKTIEQPRKRLERIWREAWRPPEPPALGMVRGSHCIHPLLANPWPFRSGNSPWMREPMEALVDPCIRLVSIIAAIQSGKTTISPKWRASSG